MEVFSFLNSHNLHGLKHNNWKKKWNKGFVTVVIENTIKVISVLRNFFFTYIVKRWKKKE